MKYALPPRVNASYAGPSRGHGPPQLLLLVRLLNQRQDAVVAQLRQARFAERVADLVDLVELGKVERAKRVNGRPHVHAAGRLLGALERVDARHVRQARLDLRQRRRVRVRREGVPAVHQRPEARQRVAKLLRLVVVDGADVNGEDDVGAERLHVRDRQVVEIAAVQQHVALVAQRRQQPRERHRRAHVAPHVAAAVVLWAALADVCRVAVEFEPEVLDL